MRPGNVYRDRFGWVVVDKVIPGGQKVAPGVFLGPTVHARGITWIEAIVRRLLGANR